ncbi:MAG: T9SS type A sorting domain-containing protein [Bacteroidota bacterium]
MKKIYVLLGATFFSTLVFAQKNTAIKMRKEKNAITEQMPTPKKEHQTKVTIWENDFSTSSDWTISNNTNDQQDWVISTSTATNLGYGTGAWVDGANTVTNENGYALFDSDAVGADGGNQDALMTYTGTIDCSAYPNVVLEFNQRIRMWQTTETIFEISNDGGTTWIPFQVNLDKTISTLYQEKGQINITSAAGGQAIVKIRLRYIGSWDYAWLVDDIKVVEQPANDVRSFSPFYAGTNNLGIEYGRTPLFHLDDSYDVGGYVFNFGSAAASNVAADVDFGTFNYSYTVGALPSGDTLMYGNTESPSTPVGVYQGLYTVNSSEELSTDPSFTNNVAKRNFEITTNLYSVDGIGVNPAELQATASLGSNSFNTPTGTIFANMYHLRGGDNVINSIEIALGSGTTANTQIQVAIIDTAELFADGSQPLLDLNNNEALSNYYVLTAADVAAGKATVFFNQAVALNDGAYYAAVLTEVGTNIIRILDDQTVTQPSYASVIHLIADGGTYTNGNALAIRVNTSVANLDEVSSADFSVYPNPASEVININSTKMLNAVVTISDLTGKVVKTSSINGLTASVNTSGLNNGIYYVTITEGNSTSTQKVVIRK